MRDVIIPTDATARFNTAVDAVVDAGRGTSGFILAHGQAGRGKSVAADQYHYQRGGAPCPADRVLTSRFGVAAAQLILQKKFGYMVALQDNHIVPVPLTEVAGKLKTVPPDGELVKQARALGLSMGD